jgi:putative DNA primase/helicase
VRVTNRDKDGSLGTNKTRKVNGTNKASGGNSTSGLVTLRASEITPKKVDWLREGVILSRRVTGIVGHSGEGKSLLTTDLAAAVSRGAPWPTDSAEGKDGWVIMLSAEDDPSDTIVPRLKAADADLDRIRIITSVRDGNGAKRYLTLASDLGRLGKKIKAMNEKGRRVRLLTIDPFSAYLGNGDRRIDRNNAAHVRGLLDQLGAFAAEHRLAIVFVLHRPKKSNGRALTQMAGSYEFVAGPRMNLLAAGEPSSDSHLLVPCKQNLSPGGIGYRYRIKVKEIGKGIHSPFIDWEETPVAISADEALSAESGKGAKRPTKPTAHDWLQGLLANRRMRRKNVMKLGAQAGFSEKQLRAAREALEITTTKSHVGSQTVWAPPSGGKRG